MEETQGSNDICTIEKSMSQPQVTKISDLNFATWESEVKSMSRVNIESIIRAFDKKIQFYTQNKFIFSSPFIILTRSDPNCAYHIPNIDIPHMSDLVSFVENYGLSLYPKIPIKMVNKMFFVIDFEDTLLHAVDGLGNGIVIMTLHGYWFIKLYYINMGEKYSTVISQMQEFVDYR